MNNDVDVEELFHQAEMAQAYTTITDEKGPSEQLLAFINFDNKLGEEIGLEGFDSMSLQTRHEIFKSKLNPDKFYNVAIESLAEKIDKTSKWVIGVGASLAVGGTLKTASSVTKGVTNKYALAAAIAGFVVSYGGIITKIANDAINGVVSSSDFEKMKRAADSTRDHELLAIRSIPSEFTPEAWQKYHDFMWKRGNEGHNKYIQSFEDAFDSFYNQGRSVSAHKSWDVENFKAANKWLEKSGKDLEDISKKYGDKLSTVAKWVNDNKDNKDPETKKVMKLINKSLDVSKKTFEDYTYMLERSMKALKRVAKMFETKKD